MTRTSRLLLAAVVAAGVLVPTGSAIAADRTGTLDSTTTSFAWDSKLGTGFTTLSNLHDQIPCGTPVVHDCDFTLLHVVGLGTLDVKETQGSPNAVDTDLYVYDSDADGTQGDLEGTSAQGSPTPNEEVVLRHDQRGRLLPRRDRLHRQPRRRRRRQGHRDLHAGAAGDAVALSVTR